MPRLRTFLRLSSSALGAFQWISTENSEETLKSMIRGADFETTTEAYEADNGILDNVFLHSGYLLRLNF